MVRVADCVPVLLADPDAGVVGAAHAGRQGLVAGVVPRPCVADARARRRRRSTAWVGPHICGACYEVPSAMRTRCRPRARRPAPTTSWGTPSLDIGAGVRAQLERGRRARSSTSRRCTRESDDLYSYRRDGAAAGRLGRA